jgi:hypothetical protein
MDRSNTVLNRLFIGGTVIAVSLAACNLGPPLKFTPVTPHEIVGEYVTNNYPIQTLSIFQNGRYVHEFEHAHVKYIDSGDWRLETVERGSGLYVSAFRYRQPRRYESMPIDDASSTSFLCGRYRDRLIVALDMIDDDYYFYKLEDSGRVDTAPR